MDGIGAEKIKKYTQLILSENKVRNITGAGTAGEISGQLIEPSRQLAEIIDENKGIDVGSGNGLPGVVAAIVRPEKNITLLDSSASRINFLNLVKRRCGLDNLSVLRGRAEKLARLAAYRERYAFAISRALAPLKISVELCLPFVEEGGRYYTMTGKDVRKKVEAAEKIITKLGGIVEKITSAGFVVIKKRVPSPGEYPRKWKKIK